MLLCCGWLFLLLCWVVFGFGVVGGVVCGGLCGCFWFCCGVVLFCGWFCGCGFGVVVLVLLLLLWLWRFLCGDECWVFWWGGEWFCWLVCGWFVFVVGVVFGVLLLFGFGVLCGFCLFCGCWGGELLGLLLLLFVVRWWCGLCGECGWGWWLEE